MVLPIKAWSHFNIVSQVAELNRYFDNREWLGGDLTVVSEFTPIGSQTRRQKTSESTPHTSGLFVPQVNVSTRGPPVKCIFSSQPIRLQKQKLKQ
jgi:hypothetical protein